MLRRFIITKVIESKLFLLYEYKSNKEEIYLNATTCSMAILSKWG